MFPRRYFAPVYFAPRYFPEIGAAPAPSTGALRLRFNPFTGTLDWVFIPN